MSESKHTQDLLRALEPFAQVAEALDFYVHEACPEEVVFPFEDVRISNDEGPGRVRLFREDFERARAAIDKARGQGGGA